MSQEENRNIAVRMSPEDIRIITDYQDKQGYPSLSSALRRIIREWAKSRQGCTCQNADMLCQFEDA